MVNGKLNWNFGSAPVISRLLSMSGADAAGSGSSIDSCIATVAFVVRFF